MSGKKRGFMRLTVLATVIKAAGIGLTFLFFVIAARKSSAEGYGTFAAMFSLATILGFALNAGQHMTVLRFWPAWQRTRSLSLADASIKWSAGRVLISGIAGGGAIFLVAVLWPITGYPQPLMLAAPAALIGMSLAFSFSEFAQAALRARGEVLISLSGREVLWRILNIGALFALAQFSGVGLIWLATATLSLVTVGQLAMVWRGMGPTDPIGLEDQQALKQSSLWFWLGTTVGPIVTHSGTVIVALFLGPKAAGAFFAADRLAKLLSIVLIAINQVLGPQLSRHYHAGEIDRVRKLVTLGSLAAGAIALLGMLVFWFLGTYALRLFGPGYDSAWGALMLLTVGQVINTFAGPNTMLMNMAGLERLNTIVMGIAGAAGLVILSLTAYLWGQIGAAAGAAAVMIFWNIIIVFICDRRLGIRPFDFSALRGQRPPRDQEEGKCQ